MKFFDLVNRRYSQRGFLNKEVEQEKIQYILDCARLAPSASNKQPWKIYLVKEKTIKNQLIQAYKKEWMAEAPLIAVFTGLIGQNWTRKDGENYLLCDVTLISNYFILAATEVDLGTCYVAAFDEKIVKEALGLPPGEKPFLLTPLGYAKEGVYKERKRKDLDEIATII